MDNQVRLHRRFVLWLILETELKCDQKAKKDTGFKVLRSLVKNPSEERL